MVICGGLAQRQYIDIAGGEKTFVSSGTRERPRL